MKARTRYGGRRVRQPRAVTYSIGFAVGLFLTAGGGAAQGLPDTVTGKAQVYDGVTFDLIHGGGRYRSVTRIRLEAVDSCELRQKARLGDVDWPCGAVATAWLASRTLGKELECRPTRVNAGGYRAQCYVDGVDIATMGLGQGIYLVTVPEHEEPLPGYGEIEGDAKAVSVGIWSSEFVMPAKWRRANGTYNPLAPQ